MAPPINVQDWYGDRHTCQIASGALACADCVKLFYVSCADVCNKRACIQDFLYYRFIVILL